MSGPTIVGDGLSISEGASLIVRKIIAMVLLLYYLVQLRLTGALFGCSQTKLIFLTGVSCTNAPSLPTNPSTYNGKKLQELGEGRASAAGQLENPTPKYARQARSECCVYL